MSSTCTYLLAFDAIADLPLNQLGAILASRPRRVAVEVRIGELAGISDTPTGVYLFYEPGTDRLMYAGKATSRSFIERIPAHFDPREGAWMNSLPKHIRDREGCTLAEALHRALALELTLVGVPTAIDGGQVEAVFRGFLEPELNPTKRSFDGATLLRDAVQASEASD